jgi:UDP-N-acetylmuramyl tripeptide synthase
MTTLHATRAANYWSREPVTRMDLLVGAYEDIREVGRLSAGLDHVIVKEDYDLRGREPGEVAALVREGLIAGGMSADEIEVILDELDAVDRVISLLGDGDIGVVLADGVPGMLAHLRGRALPASVS